MKVIHCLIAELSPAFAPPPPLSVRHCYARMMRATTGIAKIIELVTYHRAYLFPRILPLRLTSKRGRLYLIILIHGVLFSCYDNGLDGLGSQLHAFLDQGALISGEGGEDVVGPFIMTAGLADAHLHPQEIGTP
jgi:hypothetical protein